MALQLEETYKGFSVDYHRIIDTRINYSSNQTLLTLATYKDKATRDENESSFVKKQRYSLDGLYPEASTDDLRVELYNALKDKVTSVVLDEETGEYTEVKGFANAKDI